MVRIELRSAQHRDLVASVEAEGDAYRVDGPMADLIDPSEPLLGLPSGRRVTAAEDAEEWARGLVVRFRSADLSAAIMHDDRSLPEDDDVVSVDAHLVG